MRSLSVGIILLGMGWASGQNMLNHNSITLNYKFHPKFFLYAETQLRSNKDFTYPDYYEIKGGIGYNITKNHKPLVGLGRFVTYADHRLDKEEFRIWLQDVVNYKWHTVKIENRLRFEHSWFYAPQKDEHSGRNRIRYRLSASLPLNNKEIKKGTLYASAYDEIFFTLNGDPFTSRNRVYGGLGYQIDETFTLSSGYLWQREFDHNKGNKNMNFVYMNLSINLDGTKPEQGP